MSSFLKPNKTRNKPGFQIKPRGASTTGSRIHDVLHRMDRGNARSASPAPAASTAPASSRPKCPNARCPNPYAPISEGYCTGCGREIDASNIVAEVMFGETSSGAAMVQGSFVGADQGTSRVGSGLSRRIGGVMGEEKERKIREARNMMIGFQTQLRTITESTVDMGVQIFKLAINENWIQGRGMDKVVPVCLYTACRREPQCQVMLIDFADLVKINVFELGHVFKNLNDIYSFQSHDVKAVLPEDLMYRFAMKLDFGDLVNKVAEDAVRLCRRMGRDWMVMGRRPSGICGACLLIAARMWNFKRTVREVVYVVKVTTATVQQRLGEFTVTASSEMTIEEFLNQEFIESEHNPPAFYRNTAEWREKKEKEKEGAGRKRKRIEDIDDDEGGQPSANSTAMLPPPVPRPPPDLSKFPPVSQFLPKSFDEKEQKEYYAQFDPELLAAAAIPKATVDKDIAEGLTAEDPEGDTAVNELVHAYGEGVVEEEDEVVEQQASRRGKKKNQQDEPSLTFDDQWTADEKELEKQISEIINDPHTDEHRRAYATAAFNAKVTAAWARSNLPHREIKMDEIIGEDEFEDDPEVKYCLMSEEEAKRKQIIWINENQDWLRKEQEKSYRQQMEALGPPKRTRNRHKKPRIGEGQLTPASTPGEAAVEAMKKRGFSKRINYNAISDLFSDDRSNRGPGSTVASLLGDDSRPGSQRASRAASVASASTHKSAAPRPEPQQQQPEKAAAAAEPEAAEEEGQEEEDTAPVVYDDEEVEHPGYDEDEYYDQDEEEFY
ncbi:transcription factor TFIIIB subunit brf1 [Diatrype stigma]|uniref:Transcription factor TFIIIB subunit brf1 n=1 Tax=Diatrype stigma TaxID=117547 RepID=A0AAN9U7K3_9PEZI